MKNLVSILVIITCLALIIIGLSSKNIWVKSNETSANRVTDSTSNVKAETSSPVTQRAVISSQLAKYYPDDGAVAVDSASQADQNFMLTPRLLAQLDLIDKYKPGICFGTPVAPTQLMVVNALDVNPSLTKYLKQHYNLMSDLDVYNKLIQLQNVSLIETQSSNFDFSFEDGECSNVIVYQGTISVADNQVSVKVISSATKSQP